MAKKKTKVAPRPGNSRRRPVGLGANVQRVAKKEGGKLSNTERRNATVRRDLVHWLGDLKRAELDPAFEKKKLPIPTTPVELFKLKSLAFNYILEALVKILRKGRKRSGGRFTNGVVRDWVLVVQRLANEYYAEEWDKEALDKMDEDDAEQESRVIAILSDTAFTRACAAVDNSMLESSEAGCVVGCVKARRAPLPAGALAKVYALDFLTVPKFLEFVFSITVMLFAGVRGGLELSETMNWAMFILMKDDRGRPIAWVYNPNLRREKNHSGGLKDWRKVRESVSFEFLPDKAISPGAIIQAYHDAQPEGWTNPELKNRIFLKARPKFLPTGEGFYPNNYRGHNYMSKSLKKAVNAAGTPGHFTNQMGRASTVTGLMEAGFQVNSIMSRTGHTNPASLDHYNVQSAHSKRKQTEALVDGMVAGRWGAKPVPPFLMQGMPQFPGGGRPALPPAHPLALPMLKLEPNQLAVPLALPMLKREPNQPAFPLAMPIPKSEPNQDSSSVALHSVQEFKPTNVSTLMRLQQELMNQSNKMFMHYLEKQGDR